MSNEVEDLFGLFRMSELYCPNIYTVPWERSNFFPILPRYHHRSREKGASKNSPFMSTKLKAQELIIHSFIFFSHLHWRQNQIGKNVDWVISLISLVKDKSYDFLGDFSKVQFI